MIELSSFLTYVAVVFGLFLIPGPAVLLVIARSASGGPKVGMATGVGVAVGDVVHTTMATLGLSAILMTSALAFEIVKYAGVAYLVFLGINAFFEKSDDLSLQRAAKVSGMQAFRQAILAEVLNPKTALFFLAFLPQFVHADRGSVFEQFALLGATFVVMSALYTSILAFAAGMISHWVRRNKRVGRWQGKAIGILYLGLGARLAMQER